jgi:phosphoserine phosphatase RsbU/P
VIASESTPAPPTGFACGEVRGGNGTIHAQVALPGLRGVLYSRPCAGASGGDIHYLSVCGSGLLARVCLADVAGGGSAVAAVGTEMHAPLRRSVDVIDERKVLGQLNRRLNERGLGVMTTAVLATYYPPSRRLTVSYAGHPTGYLFRADTRTWTKLFRPGPPLQKPAFVDLPMGIVHAGLHPASLPGVSGRPHAALHRRRARNHLARRHSV